MAAVKFTCALSLALSLANLSVVSGFVCNNSNVSCPATSFNCVNESLGLKWACNVSSSLPGHPYTECYTGAPQPLSTTKKNVLIIGDSVSNGYFLEATPGSNVPDLVSDIALVQHSPWSPGSGGAGPTSHGLDCLDIYVKLTTGQAVKWDLITFNFGLHDLDNATSSVATYAQQLAQIADMLKPVTNKLQYHLTTPMMPTCCRGGPLLPSGEGAPPVGCAPKDNASFYRCDTVVQELNVKAQSIMQVRDIPVVDLYSTVTDVCGARYVNCSICRMEPCSFHYTPQGYAEISKPIATAIRKALA